MDPKEKLLWSIALPGFGQLLNGKYLKGILHSFNGEIEKAIERTKYQWLMFYPCVYFFAMWDAYKDASGGKEQYSYLPFVFSAYFVTVELMYSAKVNLFGITLGTVWFPMLCVIPGVFTGIMLKKLLRTG